MLTSCECGPHDHTPIIGSALDNQVIKDFPTLFVSLRDIFVMKESPNLLGCLLTAFLKSLIEIFHNEKEMVQEIL